MSSLQETGWWLAEDTTKSLKCHFLRQGGPYLKPVAHSLRTSPSTPWPKEVKREQVPATYEALKAKHFKPYMGVSIKSAIQAWIPWPSKSITVIPSATFTNANSGAGLGLRLHMWFHRVSGPFWRPSPTFLPSSRGYAV